MIIFPKIQNLYRRKKYFVKLLITACTALLIIAIPLKLLIERVYTEIDKRTTSFYIERTGYFANQYFNSLEMMKNHANRIAFDKKIRVEILESNPWYKIEAIDNLNQYAYVAPMAESLIMNFKNSKLILTQNYTYNKDRFLSVFSSGNSDTYNQLENMLNFQYKKPYVASTFGGNGYDEGRLYFSVPISIESGKDKDAVIIYSLSKDSLSTSFLSLFNEYNCGLAIYSNNTLFYTNGVFDTDSMQGDRLAAFLEDTSIFSLKSSYKSQNFWIFKYIDMNTDLVFLTTIPEDIVYSNLLNFNKYINILIFSTSLLLFTFLLFSLYYSYYKPVRNIVRKHAIGSTEYIYDDLQAIESTLAQMHDEKVQMSERHLLLMEHVIENILYGKQIDDSRIEILDKSLGDRMFCVITVNNLKLNNNIREELTGVILSRLGLKVFITDILFENHVVIIIILDEQDSMLYISKKIRQILESCLKRDIIIGTGLVIKTLNDVRASYLASLEELKANTKAFSMQSMFCEILKYVNDNITNPDLTLSYVADQYDMSIYTFSRFFKEGMGIGFKEYTSLKRFELAKTLLLTTDKKINEISTETGFSSLNYFATWFKSMCGESPSNFIKSNR